MAELWGQGNGARTGAVTPDQHGLGDRMATSVHLQKIHMVGLLPRSRSVPAPSLAVP